MNKIKFLKALFFSFMTLTGINAQFSWHTQSSPTSADLISVNFTDSIHGWIAGADGTILYTENAGEEWTTIASLADFTAEQICVRSQNLAWLTGASKSKPDSAIVFFSTNGGTGWEPVFYLSNVVIHDIFFINDTLGWITGAEVSEDDTLSLIMHSINGGENWEMAQGPRIHNDLFSIHFRDENYGQAFGEGGIFFTTNNGGLSDISGWAMNIAIQAYSKDIYDIFNAESDYGCAVGEDGIVAFTKDKWANHLMDYTSSGDTLNAITGLPDGIDYWAVGNQGSMVQVKYALFMLNLIEEERITANNLNDVYAVDEEHIWAVGDQGTILCYSKQSVSYNKDLSVHKPLVYPNPASNTIYIKHLNNTLQNLVIRSIDGKVVYKTVSFRENFEKGIDITSFPDGIYLIKVNNHNEKIIISHN